jgi:formyl-CoA transferase
VHLGALEWRFWQNFCDAIGHSEWGEKQYAEGPEAAAIHAAIAAHFLTDTRDHWVETLAHLDTCVAPVWTLEEAHESALFRAREMFVEYDHPVDGKIVQAAFPLKMTDFDFEVRPAPLHGEHTNEVLAEAGLDETELEGLRGAGVI